MSHMTKLPPRTDVPEAQSAAHCVPESALIAAGQRLHDTARRASQRVWKRHRDRDDSLIHLWPRPRPDPSAAVASPTPEKLATFLRHLEECGSVSLAAERTGIGRECGRDGGRGASRRRHHPRPRRRHPPADVPAACGAAGGLWAAGAKAFKDGSGASAPVGHGEQLRIILSNSGQAVSFQACPKGPIYRRF